MTDRLSLSRLGGSLAFGLILAGCATVPTVSTITDSSVQRLVDDYGQRVLRASENRDKAHLYQFKLADLTTKGAIGMSVGAHVIYIDYGLASKAHQNQRGYQTFLLMVLAHEIGHDVLNHAANQQALATTFTVGQQVGRGLSYAPGVIGLAGAAASWLFYGAGYATTNLYSRAPGT